MIDRRPPGPPPPPRFENYQPRDQIGIGPGHVSPRAPHRQLPRPRPLHRAPEREGGMSFVSMLLIAFLAILGLGIAGAAFVMFSLPTDFVRDQIVARVKEKTGRDLEIAGPASFSFYPSLAVTLSDVSLSAPPAMSSRPLVAMKALDVSVRLLPLLQRQLTVDHLVLREPVFNLEIDASGRKTWDFATTDQHHFGKWTFAQAAGPTANDANDIVRESATGEPQRRVLDKLALSDVRIENGTLNYADVRAGSVQTVNAINLELGVDALAGPLRAKGDAVWRSEKLAIDGTMTSLQLLLEQRPAKVVATIAGRPMNVNFDGNLTLGKALDAEGALVLKAASARALSTWLDANVPVSGGFGALDLQAIVRTAGKTTTLSDATVQMDGVTASGQISADTSGPRPAIKANLKLSELNLNTYLDGNGSAGEAQHRAAAPREKSIEDLLADPEPGPKVKGYTQRSGWSETPIDLTGLHAVDLNAKLSVGRLIYKEIKVGTSQLTVAIKNNALRTDFEDVQLYSGSGRGFITIEATSGAAKIGANLTLDGVEGQALLNDIADLDWLAGRGNVSLAVAGQGASQREIIETLRGKASFAFKDGAIVGINIPGLVRNISQGKLGGIKSAPSEKTDFSELNSTWTIAEGVAQNADLSLVSPLLRVTGSGQVQLPTRQLDYTLKPKLVANLEGQGGNQGLSGIEIPVRVRGAWEKPSFSPDLDGILKDPNKVVDTIKEIGRQFKGKNANEILDSLFGKKKD